MFIWSHCYMTHLCLYVPGWTGNDTFLNETAINERFVGVFVECVSSSRLSWCVCFVTSDNTEMTIHLAAYKGHGVLSSPLGYALCTINCSLGRKTPAVELSFCSHSCYIALSTSGVVHVCLLLAFASWKPATVDKWDYTLTDGDVACITQQPHSVKY